MEMNEAEIHFKSNISKVIDIYGISEHCYKCKLQYHGRISPKEILRLKINSIWPYKMKFKIANGLYSESFNERFKEGGIYNMTIGEYKNRITSLKELTNDPGNPNMPLYIMIGVFFGLLFLWPILKLIRRQISRLKGEGTSYFMEMEEWEQKIDSVSRVNVRNENNNNQNARYGKKRRLRSIDVFRGITIVLMIFVNYGGGGYHIFEHSVWNGLTIADLVFPWFIFIMGISIAFSFKSFQKSTKTYKQAFGDIFIRSVKMFALGLMLTMGNNITSWRVPGVLQRFAVCYLFTATLNLFTNPSQKYLVKFNIKWWCKPFKDLLPFWMQWIVILGIIAGHTYLTFALKIPGCPDGYLGPGGTAEGGIYFNCTGGSAGYIDRTLLGVQHIYGYPTCKVMYKTTQSFDPEGILGILPSIVLTFLGLQVGKVLMSYQEHKSRLVRWFIWAIVTGCLGIGLTLTSLDEGIIPINKNLWSLSFVFVTASSAYVMMIICYITNDVSKIWDGSPFYFCGMNAISLYLGHMLIAFKFYWHPDPQTHTSSLVRATVGTIIWILWAYYLHLKNLYFTV